jgi:hypothetical protein
LSHRSVQLFWKFFVEPFNHAGATSLKNKKNALQFSEDPLDKYSAHHWHGEEVAISKGGDFPINYASQVMAWFAEESGR